MDYSKYWTHGVHQNCRSFGSTGETSSVDDDLWLSGRAGYKPVLEAIGGTELGGLYLGGFMLQPQAFAAFSIPGMTMEFVILDDSSKPYVSNSKSIALSSQLSDYATIRFE